MSAPDTLPSSHTLIIGKTAMIQHGLRSVGGGVGGVLFVLEMRSSFVHVGVSLARLMEGAVTDAVSRLKKKPRRTYPCHCFG